MADDAEHRGSTPPDKLVLVQTFFQRYFDGQVGEAVTLLDPAAEYRVPGIGTPGGTFVGRAAVAGHLDRFLELTERRVDVLKWEDWLTGESSVAGVVRLELQRAGRLAHTRLVFLVEVSADARRIVRVEVFASDPEAIDRFFAW